MATLGEQTVAQAWSVMLRVGAVTTVTYTSRPEPTMDFEAGTITATPTAYPVQVIFANFQRREIDGVMVVSGDMKAFIPKDVLPLEPTTRDTLTRNGTLWSVVAVTESGNGGLWMFQVRRPGLP